MAAPKKESRGARAVATATRTSKTRHRGARQENRAGTEGASASPFQRVWSIVKRVPRGRVVTYGQLSMMIEQRLSPVGVGWAVRAAPEGSIPWHRVVNSQGGISTDREHPGLQRAMLEAEGIAFDADGHIDLARVGWKRGRSPGR